jgi:hypothetical protein
MQCTDHKGCRCFSPDIVHVNFGYSSNRVALYDLSEDILDDLRTAAITCHGIIPTYAIGVLVALVDSSNDFEFIASRKVFVSLGKDPNTQRACELRQRFRSTMIVTFARSVQCFCQCVRRLREH